jgi:hypothetical protein
VLATSAATAPNLVPRSEFVIDALGVNQAYEGQNGWVRALQKYLVDAWLEEPRTVIYVTHDIHEGSISATASPS